MKAFLPRILALVLFATTASINAAADPEAKSAGQGAASLPQRPVAPIMDNLTPAQAEPSVKEYRNKIAEWRRNKALAEKAANGTDQTENVLQEMRRTGSAVAVELPTGYDWHEEALNSGLSDPTLAHLEHDGLAIGGPFFKESFELYTFNPQPAFVTSDSLLNAFHVLLEDSVKRMESVRAGQLRKVLEGSWKNIDSRLAEEKVERAKLEPYIRHLALVIGPALRLLGSDAKLGEAELEALVEAEVKKIETAETVELPGWLGPADRQLLAIDYRRCKPIGFYADNPRLEAYYRATSWLQIVPFRLSRDTELGAIALLGDLGKYGNRDLEDYIRTGLSFWGETEDLNISMYYQYPRFLSHCKQGDIASALKIERHIYESAAMNHRQKLNDQVRLPPADVNTQENLDLRALPSTELPDATMLAELVRLRQAAGGARVWPGGLEVASWLGSKWAAQEFAKTDGMKQPERTLFKMRNGRRNEALPDLYFSALAALFLPPEAPEPAFVKSEAWQRKSVQTALAGWMQFRHTWELQAKLNAMYLGMVTLPPGFVEPKPEFFSRMSRLISSAMDQLNDAGVFGVDSGEQIEFWEKTLSEIQQYGLVSRDMDWNKELEEDDIAETGFGYIHNGAEEAAHWDKTLENVDYEKLKGDDQFRFWRRVTEVIQARVTKLKSGEASPDHAWAGQGTWLMRRWRDLERLSRQLEAMAHKQLAGGDWNESESVLLKNYGERLAGVMGYGGNAWLTPKDDAPRWTTIFSDPARNKQLAVAVGRPQALYVLYPWKGQQVLCRGAVMSYYEYEADRRLTDKEWKDELDKPNPPKRPEWLQPLLPSEP